MRPTEQAVSLVRPLGRVLSILNIRCGEHLAVPTYADLHTISNIMRISPAGTPTEKLSDTHHEIAFKRHAF